MTPVRKEGKIGAKYKSKVVKSPVHQDLNSHYPKHDHTLLMEDVMT